METEPGRHSIVAQRNRIWGCGHAKALRERGGARRANQHWCLEIEKVRQFRHVYEFLYFSWHLGQREAPSLLANRAETCNEDTEARTIHGGHGMQIQLKITLAFRHARINKGLKDFTGREIDRAG